ncbi:MAG: hypothetical protein ABI810_21730, partial [Sphingomonas bacterium]
LAGRLSCAEQGDRQRLRDLIARVRSGALPAATLAVGRCGEMPLHLRIEPLKTGSTDRASMTATPSSQCSCPNPAKR